MTTLHYEDICEVLSVSAVTGLLKVITQQLYEVWAECDHHHSTDQWLCWE